MALTAERLREVGVSMSPREVESVLLDTLRQMRLPSPFPDPRREFSADEIAALQWGGLVVEPVDENVADNPLVRTAALYTSLITTGLSVAEAAQMLRVSPSRIRQHLLAHTLYGIKTEHGWRLPLFQFDGQRLLPGAGAVFSRLDWSVHPVGVYNWFTHPDPDLQTEEDEVPLSPRDWLRSGRAPEPVARLAEALGEGL